MIFYYRQFIRQILCLILSLTLATGLAGCRQAEEITETQSSQEEIVIGVSFPTTELAYREKMREILEEEYNDRDDIRLEICDADGSQEQQNEDIIRLADEGVDGIVLIPLTTEGPVSAVKYANNKNIPVITVDNRLEDSGGAEVIGYVGANHVSMGAYAAQLLTQTLKEKHGDKAAWDVIEITGSTGASGTIDREKGIDSVLSKTNRVNIVASYNADFTIADAKSIMEDCLVIWPDIDGIICQNDLMALGCYEALEEAGKLGDVVLIGIDGQRDVVERMVSGGIDGTVIQYPDMILTGVKMLTEYIGGDEIQPVCYTEIDPISAGEAQSYLDQDLPW